MPEENKVNIRRTIPAAHDGGRRKNRAGHLIGKTGTVGGKKREPELRAALKMVTEEV